MEEKFCCQCGEYGHYYFEHFTIEQEMREIFSSKEASLK